MIVTRKQHKKTLNAQSLIKENGGLGEHANGNDDIRYKDGFGFVFPQRFFAPMYIGEAWD